MENPNKTNKKCKINQKGRDALGKVRQKLADAHRKEVDYATTNPGDSHRPGRTTENHK